MKKVLIITYYWPPSGGSGVQRWLKMSKYLPEFGWEPVVLTVDPAVASYPQIDNSLLNDAKGIETYRTKTFEFYSLYAKMKKDKQIPYGGFSNESDPSLFHLIMRFVRGNFFIPDPRRGWNKFAFSKAEELIKKYEIDTVVTTSPPHSTQLVGIKLKKIFNVNWIADLRDPWTNIYYYGQLYHSPLAKRIDRHYEKSVLTKSDKTIVVSPSIKRYLLEKYPELEESKFLIIPNGYDEDDFQYQNKTPNKKFIITYTGTIASNYNIDSFLEAMQRMIETMGSHKILLRFVGIVSKDFQSFIDKSSLKKSTELIGHVEHSDSVKYLLQSNALLLAIPNVKNNEGILTGKLFEYLGARRPIIGIGPVNGDAAQIIKECNAGVMFRYNDRNKIFNYVKDLYVKWQKGEKVKIDNDKVIQYSRKNLTKSVIACF